MSYFYGVCITGIIAGTAKALVSEKYKNQINLLCCFVVLISILSPLRSCSLPKFEKNEADASASLAQMFSDRLETELEAGLLDNEYCANIRNIDCECKDNKMSIVKIEYSGDREAKAYITEATGVSAERVEYIEE